MTAPLTYPWACNKINSYTRRYYSCILQRISKKQTAFIYMCIWVSFNAIIYVSIEKFQLVNDAGRSRCVFARFSKFYSCKLLARLPIYQLTFCIIHSYTLYGTNPQTQHCNYFVVKVNHLRKNSCPNYYEQPLHTSLSKQFDAVWNSTASKGFD